MPRSIYLPANALWGELSKPGVRCRIVTSGGIHVVTQPVGAIRSGLFVDAERNHELYVSGYQSEMAMWLPLDEADGVPDLRFIARCVQSYDDATDDQRKAYGYVHPTRPTPQPLHMWAVPQDVHAFTTGAFVRC